MEEKRKINSLIIILSVVIVVLLIFSLICLIQKNKAENLAKEYETANLNLIEKNEKATKTAEEYKTKYLSFIEESEREKQTAEEYQKVYNEVVYLMLDGGILAEKMGNLTVKVWNNAIWKKHDEETDKFTISNGRFVSDFNDALSNLFNDEEFLQNYDTLVDNRNQVKNKIKNLFNPPKDFENSFKAIESYYVSYLLFTDSVMYTNGRSLESFSKEFHEWDSDSIQKYYNAELYVK